MSLVDPAKVGDSFNTEASKSRKKNRPRTRPKPDQFDLQPESNDSIQQPEEVLTPNPIPASLRRRPATPQVRANVVRDSNFISEEEGVAYQQDAITENIRQQAKIERNRARLSGSPITMEEAIVRVRTRDSGLRVNPVTGRAHPQGDVYSKKPMTPKQVAEQAERKFPELTAMAKLSGLTPEEQAAAVSLPLAIDALRKIAATQNPTRQQQLMNTMGPDMQALVFDLLNAWEAEAKSNREKRAESEETGKNLVTDAIGFFWDYTFGPILDGLIAAQKTLERGVLQVGYLSGGASIGDATAATEEGALDPEMVDYAREYFGATVVEVILEEMEASKSSNPQKAIAELFKKYGEEGPNQDLEKLSILENSLSDETGALYNQNVLDAITYLHSALTDNLGNAVNWSYGAGRSWLPFDPGSSVNPLSPEGVKYSQNPMFTATRDMMNVLAMFRTDVLLLGGGVRKAYVLGKYGFKNMDALEISAVFQTKGTRTFFDEVGATLRKADEAQAAGDGGKAAQIMNSARSTYKKYFTADALQALRKANVRTADEAETFFQDAKNLEYMVAGQLAKRNNQLVIPHMTMATAMAKRASLIARKVTYDRNASKHIDEVFGEGTAAMIPEEAQKVISKQLLEGGYSEGERFIGRFFSDFVFANNKAKRTFIGKIVSFLRKDNSKQRYGYQREKGFRRRAERLARPISRTPDLSNGLIIADGSHAYKIREMAMVAGMPKYWADYASELWKVMEPGERKLFAGGLGRSAGYALGIDIVDSTKGTKLISEMVSGTRGGEMYAPAWINTVAIQGEARRTVLANNPELVPAYEASRVGVVENVVKKGNDQELPSYSFGKNDEVIFLGIDDTLDSALSTKGVTQVQATPEGLLKEALRRDPSNAKLKSMLDNFNNKDLGPDEVNLLDEIISAMAIDDAGKINQLEQTSGLALVLSSLTGNVAAKKLLATKVKAFKDNVDNAKISDNAALKPSTSGVEPAAYSDIVGVHSTQYPVVRNADGSVSLKPNANFTPGSGRSTIHFTLNSEVKSHVSGQWDDTNKLIVTNTEEVVAANGKPANLNPIDSWWSVSPGQQLNLPNASVISPYIDEAKYVAELEKRGLLKPGENPPAIVEDLKTNDVFYFSKSADKYTDADRIQILEATGKSSDKYSVAELAGKESETLRRHALDLAMRQQKVSSGPESLGQWGYNYNTELGKKIDSLRSNEGVGGSIHQGTSAQRLELSRGTDQWNRFDGAEIETYRWLAAQGLVKTTRNTPRSGGSRVEDGVSNVEDSVSNQVQRMEELVSAEVEKALKTQNIETPTSPNFLKASKFGPEDAEQEAAIYLYQMTDRIGMASFPKLSELSMRQSYLSAILGQTDAFSTATDYWTLATIGGPRFFLRNGIEDASLYALTGGSWQGFRQGQMWSKAKREATMRGDRWDLPEDSKKTVGNKLGLFFTGLRYIGDVLPKSLQTIILPHLSNAEIKLAATMGRSGNREGLVKLISKAYMRRQGMGITPGARYDPDTLRYLDEAVEDPSFFNIMDIASESPEDMLSGRIAGSVHAEINSAIINGEIKTIRGVVIPSTMASTGKLEAANSWLRSVMNIVHGDGVYGPKAISLIEKEKGYYYAVSSGDTALKNEIIKEYADFIEANLDRGMQSSAIYVAEGAEGMARRKLDDGLRIFSDNNGSLNTELLGLISVTDKNGVKSYATYREEGGTFIPLVTEEKLMELPLPYSVMSSPPVLMPILNGKETKRLTQAWWSVMGRSLARFTREPIFISNYIEARKFIQPIETRLAAEFGEAYAKKWAVTNGYERAFNLTMAYVDNPQIRSQMAWSLRNVSRFYRAQEDFFRRMMRVAKNNPLAIEKLNLSWHALDETGFVNENEYGEKIFTWPGNKVTTEAINFFTEKALARNFLEGAALVDFTSSITRLSPSADPQAIPYTLSGPYPAVGLPALMHFFPALKSLNEELAGDMSVDRSWMEGAIPTTAKNALALINSIRGEDKFTDAEGRSADYAKSAILIYAASRPEAFDQNKSYSNSELRKLQEELNVLGVDISILKSLSGPTMPASINVSDEQVSSFAKSLGITGFRTVYIELLKLNEGDSNMALKEFTAAHPGQSIFAVSKNTGVNNFGNFPSTKETQKFIEENMEQFEENSSGISFFAPQDGVSNIEAWRYLRAQGATIPERSDYYFNEMLTAEGYAKYRIEQNRHYDQMKLFSKAITNTPPSENDSAVKLIKEQMSRETKIHEVINRGLYVDYEMLESRVSGSLKTSGLTSRSDSEGYLKDVKSALVYMEGKKDVSERTKATRKLFDGYEIALSARETMNPNDAQATKNNSIFKTQWATFIRAYEDMYPEDSQWKSLISSMNGSLRLELN